MPARCEALEVEFVGRVLAVVEREADVCNGEGANISKFGCFGEVVQVLAFCWLDSLGYIAKCAICESLRLFDAAHCGATDLYVW